MVIARRPRLRAPTFGRLASALLAPALLAACAVGPDHVRPDVPVPARFAGAEPVATADPNTQERAATADHAASARSAASAGGTDAADAVATPLAVAPAGDAFWVRFGDPLLTRLVEDALAANHDLRIALSRYDRANALLRGARLDRLPTITASASVGDTRASDSSGGSDGKAYSAGIDASWELDLFGRVRRGVEAQRAEAWATAADLDALQVAVVGEVARTYVELRGLQERLRVAQHNAANQRRTLRLIEARLQAGRGTEFDASRGRAQLEATLARVPALEAAVAVDRHRLAVLTGRTPDALRAELVAPADLPALPARLDAGTPGDLLRRRPDVAAAEQRLHASTARIGVATADLFPRVTLGGLLGSQAIDSSALFESGSETRVVALGIDWSFLDVGRVRARIAAADADAAGDLARYQQAVLLALEDTENALVRHARARVEDQHLERAAIDSARASSLARLRFDAGATDLLDVLDAERTQLQAQDAFADARTRTVTSLVALYRAMAGGWPGRIPVREAVAGN